jgi:predicted RNA-binding Zn-ribbon protein involved in translation (DUF1610 family)
MAVCTSCGYDLSGVGSVSSGVTQCPSCGSIVVYPPPTKARAEALPTSVELGIKFTGEALTLIGIWYGVLVAIFGVVVAVIGGHWVAIYAVLSLLAGVLIFWPFRAVIARYAQRYVEHVSVRVLKPARRKRGRH